MENNTIVGKTRTGFEYALSESVLNDYELVESISELEVNPLILTSVITRVLGKEQSDKLKEHVRNEAGIVQTDLMMNEITDIFTSSGDETKNS